jgi:hypothetical protein
MEWLCLVLNTFNGTICVTEKRITTMLEGINLGKSFVSSDELDSIVGKIIFAVSVHGNISLIMTRYCPISIAAACSRLGFCFPVN